ncbi:MAG: DUF2933 domain-containing protein [Actinobacteria bacterium]|nr:DUF2933 domain-containing protein [Actinomycetota bacterium]
MLMCLKKKVIGGLVAAAVAIYLLVPDLFAAALPLLILAACPLSMLLMMRMMSGGSTKGSTDTEGSSGDVDELAQLRGEVDRLRAEQGGQRTASETPDLR